MEIHQDMNNPVDNNTLNTTEDKEIIKQRPTNPKPATGEPCATNNGECNEKKHCNGHKCLCFINILMFVGLIVLYIFHFTGFGTHSKHNPKATAPVIAKDGVLKVAYVDSDTLLAKYEYAKELEKKLLEYKNTQENNYRSQMTQFQNDYNDFIQNGEKLSLSQQQAKEKELKQRAEKLSTLEAELALQIQNKQIEENTKLLNAIFGFIKEYNEANQQYDIILRKTFNDSPTLYMSDAMDITQEIIDGLNEEYEKIKK